MGVYHILNGDALKSQFPIEALSGELIVARECLVDGDVSGETLEEFFATRAKTLVDLYGPLDQDYYEKVAPEINKTVSLSEGEVNLWFEDDLFCQVNLWFVSSLVLKKDVLVNLVRPTTSIQFGFGSMNQEELVSAFEQKTPITSEDLEHFASLWAAYQKRDSENLLHISNLLQPRFSFLPEAVKAQIERGDENKPGRPEKTLLQIIEEVGPNFKLVFPEFCKREAIYGFGDLQVKRLFDQLTTK